MISIIRPNEGPSKLNGSPRTGDHYNHRTVVDALLNMQHEKCCYCERRIPDEGLGKQVEHFRPKSRQEYAHLRNHWPNLLLACGQCNHHKGKEFPTDRRGNALMIDPSDPRRNPEKYITFVVDEYEPLFGQAKERKRSILGRKSVEVTGIDSRFFREERAIHFFNVIWPILGDLLEAARRREMAKIDIQRGKLEDKMAQDARFAAFVRAFARAKELDKLCDVTIPYSGE